MLRPAVIFNLNSGAGIHDTWVHQYVPPRQYGKNLERIFTMGKAGLAPGGKLIWSSTTPISSNCTGCGNGTTTDHVVEYNAIALEAFKKVVGTTEIGVVTDLCCSGLVSTHSLSKTRVKIPASKTPTSCHHHLT